MKVNQKNFEKKLYVGLGEITPLCFNPTRKELKKIFGKEDEEKENEEEEEIEYVNDEFELTLKKENGEVSKKAIGLDSRRRKGQN